MTPIFMASDRDIVCSVDFECCVFDRKTLELESRYSKTIQFVLANMMMPEYFHHASAGNTKPTTALMQDKGSWITYITRYCLIQTMGLSSSIPDLETQQNDDVRDIKNEPTENVYNKSRIATQGVFNRK